MRTLEGAVVLLTGATSGIGEQLAWRLAREPLGALLLTGRRGEVLKALRRELQGAYPGLEVETFVCDLGERQGATNLFAAVCGAGFHPTVLVPNAGVGYAGGFLDAGAEHYRNLIELNNRAVVDLTYAFLPDILAAGARGGILFVASTSCYAPCPLFTVYAASKAFVRHFAEGLAQECRPAGTHVVCVTPGGCRSTGFDGAAGMNVSGLGLTLGPVTIPYPTEDAASVARASVAALKASARWRNVWPSVTVYTSRMQQLLMTLSCLLVPRWFLAALQGRTMSNSLPPEKRATLIGARTWAAPRDGPGLARVEKAKVSRGGGGRGSASAQAYASASAYGSADPASLLKS